MMTKGLDAADAMWRQQVLELLTALVESTQRTERTLAQLGAVLAARRPGRPAMAAAAAGKLDVGQRAVEIVREHQQARWQRLQLPILRALDKLHGKATRTELNEILRCSAGLLTQALVALESDGFVKLSYVRLNSARRTTMIEATELALAFKVPAEDDAALAQ